MPVSKRAGTQDFHTLSAANSDARDECAGEQGEQDEAARVLPPVGRSGDRAEDSGDADGDRDPDRQDPRLPQDELAHRAHQAAASSTRGRRPPRAPASIRTAAWEIPSQIASTISSEASPSGQSTPRPSAQKNVPKVVSTSPTTYLSSLSGRRRSGRCRTSPSPITSASATAEPTTVGARPPGRAASTVTMRITSTPSRNTPLNAMTKPGQSNRPAAGGSTSARASRSATNSA